MQRSPDVLVIGGGISGVATAFDLARQGVSVTLLERGALHSMASGKTLAGVRQSGRHHAELPLAKMAVRRWETLNDELDAEAEYRQDGNLRLALTPDDVPIIQQVVADALAAGIEATYLDGADAVHAVAPTLTPDLAGASFCPTDGHANNELAVQAFARAAQRHGGDVRTGVEVLRLLVEGDRVSGVETPDGRLAAETVIVAAGIDTPRLLSPLGLDLPLEVVLCPVVQTEVAPPSLRPVLGVADGTFAGRQEASGRYRLIGRSLPWSGGHSRPYDSVPTLGHIASMVAGISRALPEAAALRMHRIWGGLIDRTPDALPVIDADTGVRGLVVAAGFSGHGFGIGPATGAILAALALGDPAPCPIDAFRLDRFRAGVEVSALAMHG
jgi:sarcosine oxidase subunit beta